MTELGRCEDEIREIDTLVGGGHKDIESLLLAV